MGSFMKKIGIFPKTLNVNIGIENTQIPTGIERATGWCLTDRNQHW
jgi:hypothetical protein